MSTISLRAFVPFALVGVTLVSGACGKKDAATGDSTTTTSAASSTATTSTSTPPSAGAAGSNGAAPADPSTFSDANILAKEIAGDSAEVVLAGVARTMATDPAVKAYAAQLVTDHSKGMKETVALAAKLSITPEVPAGDTTSAGTAHMRTRLQGLAKGPAFDTVFVNHEIEDHKDDIKDARAMTGAAKAPQVKAMLEKSIPELQKHLDHAQRIAAGKK